MDGDSLVLKLLKKPAYLIVVLIAVGAVFFGWRTLTERQDAASAREPNEAFGEGSEEEGEEEDKGYIKMTAEERAEKNVESIFLAPRQLSEDIIVPGEVTANRYRTIKVAPRISAQIIARNVVRGQEVETGAPLVTLSSVDMADAQGALLISDTEWRRVRDLGRAVVSEKRFLEAQVARQQAYAKLLSYGMAEREIQDMLEKGDAGRATGEFVLFATQGGTVVRDDFTVGEFIEPGGLLVEISDESTVWAEARLSPEQAGLVEEGASARVRASADHWKNGTVVQLQHALDITTRTLMARVEVDNEDDDLHGGQFVEVAITTGASKKLLAVPQASMFLLNGAPAVFRVDGDVIHPVPIETGASAGDWIEIKNGVSAGDEIVTTQTFLLKSLILKSKIGDAD